MITIEDLITDEEEDVAAAVVMMTAVTLAAVILSAWIPAVNVWAEISLNVSDAS